VKKSLNWLYQKTNLKKLRWMVILQEGIKLYLILKVNFKIIIIYIGKAMTVDQKR
jgi:hypothetical protein